ncbi:MAG: hypothetical protein PUB37_05845 [Firmicutes bacterium]|nr:hypothetical protein [Bacillota bacterium]
MRMVKYFLRRSMLVIYSLISLFFTVLISLIACVNFSVNLFFVLVTLLCMIRVTDDIFDFERDAQRRTQLLSKKELVLLDIALSVIFCTANIFSYGYIGTVALLFVPYVILEEKFTVMQQFLMFLLSLYYLTVSSPAGLLLTVPTYVFLIFSLIIPLFYGVYKRSRSK